MSDKLIVKGAREHNLKDISVEMPRNSFVVITGLSGSGKSSLAFDTIFAEGQRRYVESLSAYARQFLGQLDKPDVDFIEGLSPAISIDQKSSSHNPRSTVGTITEIYDYLRLLYARTGQPHCPTCGDPVSRQTPSQIVDMVMELPEDARFSVLAPVVRGRKGEYQTLLDELTKKGYARVRIDGNNYELSDRTDIELARYESHTIEVVIDRLIRHDGIERRLTDSVEAALGIADGVVEILVHESKGSTEEVITFSEHLACVRCGISFDELEPRNFSFNSPFGACKSCLGLGTRFEVDPELVVPNQNLALIQDAIAPWASARSNYFRRLLAALAEQSGFSLNVPWKNLGEDVQKLVLFGNTGGPVTVRYTSRFGTSRKINFNYEGVVNYLQRRHSEADSDYQREAVEGYMRQAPCHSCEGARLKPEFLAVTVGDLNIHEICSLSIGRTRETLGRITQSERDKLIAAPVLREILARLDFLLDVGLDYLTLARAAGTLSGGEAQRIRLASQIGSGLTGVLYVLDEPSIGLHQRDNHRLIDTLVKLKRLDNTVIVVEHDEETIRAADYIIDIGPGAGEHGGEVVACGSVEDLVNEPRSISGAYLGGKMHIPVPPKRRDLSSGELIVRNARQNNLKGIDVEIPLGAFVVVTGVSGSGKSSLVNEIVLKSLMRSVYGSKVVPGLHDEIVGSEKIDKVVDINQSPIGRTPRSNAATYTGVFDHIRRLFAQTPEARVRGYQPGRFSFNVKGGRCEGCSGDGTLKIEMNFLPDVYVPCEVCKGSRYNRDTLEVTFKGKNISDVLNMPTEEALAFFSNQASITRYLSTLVEVGLGYVRLGQPAPTLSGGEAQRVKLASELAKRPTGHTMYILDEPTTGLHFEDIRKLLSVLGRLVDTGNTVLVIEHNLDVIKTADYLIDLGPEGGDKGGLVIATGTPESVAQSQKSYTGAFLKNTLAKRFIGNSSR
ncbi:MAG: excinuclease ABC subunit UvrA [Acidimicrobiaceae bacterium]|nr:excinuclease ABC subunit UvrA [Acidimicrobiaceae bacterium]